MKDNTMLTKEERKEFLDKPNIELPQVEGFEGTESLVNYIVDRLLRRKLRLAEQLLAKKMEEVRRAEQKVFEDIIARNSANEDHDMNEDAIVGEIIEYLNL